MYTSYPAWLEPVHKKLDEAAFTAYGSDINMGYDQILEKQLTLNLERAKKE